ncbi:SPFH domain-containing protein [Streptomyces sp. NPDC096030]|uniref:SPFH domain-containing protein n=1 Tax=Streptomyces sp. NPDC096030 TaxID=3155423 RepID=UPI003330F14C
MNGSAPGAAATTEARTATAPGATPGAAGTPSPPAPARPVADAAAVPAGQSASPGAVVATPSAARPAADASGAPADAATGARAPGTSGPEVPAGPGAVRTASGAGPAASGARTPVGATSLTAARPAADAPSAPADSANGAPTPGAPAAGLGAKKPDAVGAPAAAKKPDAVDAAEVDAKKPGASAVGAEDSDTSPRRPAAVRFDPRRIVRGDVGVVAVPVVAEPHVAVRHGGRRKNVIGAETTGSIPVHLLFRKEPDADDDGGPATVAMAAPVPAPAPKAVIPAPTRAEPSRPAPTADPQLVERDGAVLPGWTGVVAGTLALIGCAAVLWWVGAVPDELTRMLRLPPRPYHGIHLGQWALLALGVLLTLFSLGGLGRGRVGYAWVLTLFGDYRGTVRRTGLVWVSPLLLRRRVDIRLRHWRSEPLSAVDAKGTALRVVVLVVWRIRDTVRAALGVDGHEDYLREQVEAAMARVLSQLPADAFHEDAPTLRDAEAVGEALTRMLSAECAPVGIDVFSAQPTRIEYAPEIAAAMQRRRIAAIDAKHRDSVLTSVVDAVDDVVHRLTTRGLVELDDYERKSLVKDLTVAFYTGRTEPVEGA